MSPEVVRLLAAIVAEAYGHAVRAHLARERDRSPTREQAEAWDWIFDEGRDADDGLTFATIVRGLGMAVVVTRARLRDRIVATPIPESKFAHLRPVDPYRKGHAGGAAIASRRRSNAVLLATG